MVPDIVSSPNVSSKLLTVTPDGLEFNYAVVDVVLDVILKMYSPKCIILFGSVARHEATPDSDVDLLIVMDTDVPFHRRTVDLHYVLGGLMIPADVLIVTPQEFISEVDDPYSLFHQVVEEGVCIYGDCP